MNYRKILVNSPWNITLEEDVFTEKIEHPSDIIVRNHFSHLSAGTEMACVSGKEDWFNIPGVPGYTAVGEVLETGDAVDKVQKGDMVYTFGPHAELFKVNLEDRWHGVCVPLPVGLDPDIAAFTHMGGIAMSSIRTSNIELGDYVAVSGMGTIGNLAAQFAQLQGARVLAIDIVGSRLEIAGKCGIDLTINTNQKNLEKAIDLFTGGRKVTTWIDATGVSPVINDAVNYIAMNGELILLGSPRDSFQTDITPLLRKIHLLDNIKLKGALEFLYPTFPDEFNKHSIERNSEIIMSLMNEGKLHIRPLYSHKLDPGEASSAYKGLRDNPEEYIGVVFNWTR